MERSTRENPALDGAEDAGPKSDRIDAQHKRRNRLTDLIGLTLVAGCLLGGVLLFGNLLQDWRHNNGGNPEIQLRQFQNELTKATEKMEQLKHQFDQKLGRLKQIEINGPIPDPGPRPSAFWHPIDHFFWWPGQRALFEEQERITSELNSIKAQITDAENLKRSLQLALDQLAAKLDAMHFLSRKLAIGGAIWNLYVRPVLHVLVILFLFSSAVKIAMRLLLIHDLLPVARITSI